MPSGRNPDQSPELCKAGLQKDLDDVQSELVKKREEVIKVNTQVHVLNNKLFQVKDSIRRLAHDAEGMK